VDEQATVAVQEAIAVEDTPSEAEPSEDAAAEADPPEGEEPA
jgi:hypothetical protein